MLFGSNRVRLIRGEGSGSDDMPKYIIAYKSSSKKGGKSNREILSPLIGDRDIIIELNSDLFLSDTVKRSEYVSNFIEFISRWNLEYVSRKRPSSLKTNIFSINIDSRKKPEAHEALIYVPNSIWLDADFQFNLPDAGARYYLVKEPPDCRETLLNLWSLSDEEKAKSYEMILFDLPRLEQIGIIATQISIEEIRKLLVI